MTRPIETDADLARAEVARIGRRDAAIRYQNTQARPASPHPLSRLSDLVAELEALAKEAERLNKS